MRDCFRPHHGCQPARYDDTQGKKYAYQPEFLMDKLPNSNEWKEFVEMYFNPGSPINNKLKEMFIQMAGTENHI